MAAVLGLDADRLAALCRAIDGVVVVANDNAPGQTVLSGEAAAVARAGEAASAAGARRVIPLNVAGAFHSPLMAEASEAFGAVVGRVAIGRPAITIIGNVDAAPLVDPEAIRAELSRQIAAPVRWRESIEWLAAAGMARAIECGPGNVLTGLLRRTTVTVEARTLGTYAEVETLADELRAGPG
jgi:[acyl-carrier-protein] S-malonyltransferase